MFYWDLEKNVHLPRPDCLKDLDRIMQFYIKILLNITELKKMYTTFDSLELNSDAI